MKSIKNIIVAAILLSGSMICVGASKPSSYKGSDVNAINFSYNPRFGSYLKQNKDKFFRTDESIFDNEFEYKDFVQEAYKIAVREKMDKNIAAHEVIALLQKRARWRLAHKGRNFGGPASSDDMIYYLNQITKYVNSVFLK